MLLFVTYDDEIDFDGEKEKGNAVCDSPFGCCRDCRQLCVCFGSRKAVEIEANCEKV